MNKNYLIIVAFFFCLSSLSLSGQENLEKLIEKSEIIGTFKVITIRNASDVANQADPIGMVDVSIGQNITFNENGLEMDGMSCQKWEVFLRVEPVINAKDPMLGDIHVAPTDAPKSAGEKRIGDSYHYMCEDESFMHVYQVDKRVIVIPWQNSSRYLIAEIPLSSDQISTLQSKLKDMKFSEVEPNGDLDQNTLSAISSWSNYRLGSDDGYRFMRTVITENLLDTLDVLE